MNVDKVRAAAIVTLVACLGVLMAAPAIAATLVARAAELPASLPAAGHALPGPADGAARRLTVHRARKARVDAAGLARATAAYAPSRTVAPTDELADARAILAKLAEAHPLLGTSSRFEAATVSLGQTPDGYQAVAYYRIGRIVVSPTHTAPLEKILAHEAGHVLDWRDNGRIDWGESPRLP